MINFKFHITFTNTIGAIVLILSLAHNIESGIWAGATLMLGRSAVEQFSQIKK
jgi:hypothetical protein